MPSPYVSDSDMNVLASSAVTTKSSFGWRLGQGIRRLEVQILQGNRLGVHGFFVTADGRFDGFDAFRKVWSAR